MNRISILVLTNDIQITIPSELLKFVTEAGAWNYSPEKDRPFFRITDEHTFSEEVAVELIRELGEDGSTLLTAALDKACLAAIENGCEGVDFEDPITGDV